MKGRLHSGLSSFNAPDLKGLLERRKDIRLFGFIEFVSVGLDLRRVLIKGWI
jgi:hypothetical protein